MLVVKRGYCMDILNDCNWHRSVKMLQNKYCAEGTSAQFQISYEFSVYSKAIYPSLAIRKTTNISTAILRRKVPFTDPMQSLPTVAQSFQEAYGVRFVDLCKMKIKGDIMFFNF